MEERIFSQVQATVIRDTSREALQSEVKACVSLFDRIVHGTYIKPEPQYLSRYVDEQTFRFNQRGGTDLTQFINATTRISGKRLTYEELTTSHLGYMVVK